VIKLSQDDVTLREDTHELCYNAACMLIGHEQYKEALDKLQQAEGLWLAYIQLVCFTCKINTTITDKSGI